MKSSSTRRGSNLVVFNFQYGRKKKKYSKPDTTVVPPPKPPSDDDDDDDDEDVDVSKYKLDSDEVSCRIEKPYLDRTETESLNFVM